jgi:hypothetical protein
VALGLAGEEVDEGADDQAAEGRDHEPPVPLQTAGGREGVDCLGQHAFVVQPLEAVDALEGGGLDESDQETEYDRPDGAAQTHGHGYQHHEEVAGRPLGGGHGIDGGLLAAPAS